MKTLIKFTLSLIVLFSAVTLCTGFDSVSADSLFTGIKMPDSTIIMAGAVCLPVGSCTKTYSIKDEDLEDRTYGREDSALLRALAYQDAVMLKGERYMTVLPNVKTKRRLSREEFSAPFQSAANGGRGKTDCGPFTPNGQYKDFNSWIYTYYMYNEIALCYKKLNDMKKAEEILTSVKNNKLEGQEQLSQEADKILRVIKMSSTLGT